MLLEPFVHAFDGNIFHHKIHIQYSLWSRVFHIVHTRLLRIASHHPQNVLCVFYKIFKFWKAEKKLLGFFRRETFNHYNSGKKNLFKLSINFFPGSGFNLSGNSCFFSHTGYNTSDMSFFTTIAEIQYG